MKDTDSDQGLMPALREGIYTSVGIDKEDVLAIAIAKRESDLETAYAEANAAVKAMSEDLITLNGKITATAAAMAKTYDQSRIGAAVNALAAIGIKPVTPTVTSELSVDDTKSAHVTLTITLEYAKADRRYGRDTFVTTITKPLTSELKKLLKERRKLVDDVMSAKRTLITITQEQGKLGLLERRARAQMAVASLQKTDQGRELLKELNNVTVSKLPALPARCAKRK